jgi:hypothetical protein
VAIAIQGDVDMAQVADEFLNPAPIPTANATGPPNTQVN